MPLCKPGDNGHQSSEFYCRVPQRDGRSSSEALNLGNVGSKERSCGLIGSTNTNGSGAILILGEPRSGTSWLAKMFDSHPDVIYRHEPDISYRPTSLPAYAPHSEEDAYIDRARAYLNTLAGMRTMKAAGPLPVFPKRYRSGLGRALRTGLILGARGLEKATRGRRGPSQILVPDQVSPRSRQDVRIAMKSVSLLPYVRLLAKAWPQSRIVIIVRHPCGQVASVLRGVELGKLTPVPFTGLAKSDEAARLGLRMDEYETLSIVEKLAWGWTFSNERMLREIDGLSNVKVVVYEDLAADPVNVAQSLFAFARLSWDPQVERFIRDSTQHQGTGFYSLKRNPLYAANRWRETLSADDQRRILAIVSRARVGRAFLTSPPDRHDRRASSRPETAVPVSSGSIS